MSIELLFKIFALLAATVLMGLSQARAQEARKIMRAGDLLYRFADLQESSDEKRMFQQIRARIGAKADVQEDLTAAIRLATATSSISSNQTLGDPKEPGMARHFFGVDLAYADWHPVAAIEFSFRLGRVPNPFWAPLENQMIFDAELAFEGVSISTTYKIPASGFSTFGNAGGFIISENYSAPYDVVDTGLFGAELGIQYADEDIGKVTARLGRIQFLNIVDRVVTSVENSAKVDPYSYPFDRVRGNTVYPNDPLAAPADRRYFYKFDFVQNVAGLEWKKKIGEVDVMIFLDAVLNEHASESGSAHETGLAVKHGRAQLTLAKSRKESDSVVGAFSDSDFSGGGTDNEGTKIGFSYQMSDHSTISYTRYSAVRGIDSVNREYLAQHLDLAVHF